MGGATIAFCYLVDYLQKEKESFTLINTQKFAGGFMKIWSPIYVIFKVLFNLFKADVVFLNTSKRGTQFLAPILYYLVRIFGKKFVFRPFGGNMKEYSQKYGPIQKWLFEHTVLQSDILFLETKGLMNHYSPTNANISQLPNARNTPSPSLLKEKKPFSKRFIYLGFLYSTKGIDHIIEARQQLGEDYTIHIYGPLHDEKYIRQFKQDNEIYQGVLQKDKVLDHLKEYDVLILPTYYEGEGHPGVIVEAYSLGLPVITTEWKSIPEIVEDGKTGKLITPKSTEALVNAMQYFNTSNYSEYSEQALTYFNEHFSARKVTGRAIMQIKNLVHPSQKDKN